LKAAPQLILHCRPAAKGVKMEAQELFEPPEVLIREPEFTDCLLENIMGGVIACDAGGRLILFNHTARQWFGGDYVGHTIEQWATDHDCYRDDGSAPLPGEETPLVRALKGEKLASEGVAIVIPGKPARFLRVSGGPIWDVARRKLGALVVMRDVTKLRQGAEYITELEGSKSTLRDIAEQRRIEAIYASRLHLLQYAAGHSLGDLLEETLNEAEKLTSSLIGFFHFVAEDQKSLTLQNWSTRTKAQFCKAEGKGMHYPLAQAGVWVDCVYQGKAVIHNDYASLPHRRGMPQGHAEVIRELVVPVYRGNKARAILGVGNKSTDYTEKDIETTSLLADLVWEIAERKQAAEMMLQSEQRLRFHLEKSPLGFLEWDDKFRAVEWNAACERIFGYTRQEAIGRHAKDLILPAEVHNRVDRIYESLMNQTADQHNINENITKDGRIITCEWFCTTLIDKDGNANGIASLCRDITEQKKLVDELYRYREQLEELVKERTAGLEAANKELEAFAYSVSHDLRAPLRHIDGFLELLQKQAGKAIDAESRHYMDAISNAAKKMGQLIDDLLSFSRMGRQAITFQPVDLGDLVRHVIREFEPDVAGRNIQWRIGELPWVEADDAMLRIVVANLISNALKFTRPRPQTRIEIGSLPGQDTETTIFVRDNGVGFDTAYVDKLFGVFQRLHRADEFEGTGIGLANVRRIIARHGGRTWAQGRLDEGATFYFALPRSCQGGVNGRH
jgi:PAS domain S-box-containing protein